jgi:hypothetical protein
VSYHITTRHQNPQKHRANLTPGIKKVWNTETRHPSHTRDSVLGNATRLLITKSHDSSVGIALGYRLDDRGSRVRFPPGTGNFSLHHRVQNGSEDHSASYPMGTRGSFPVSKAAGAWRWPLTST